MDPYAYKKAQHRGLIPKDKNFPKPEPIQSKPKKRKYKKNKRK